MDRSTATPATDLPARVAARHADAARRSARWLICLPVVALLASQWLAVVHGVTHKRGSVPRGVAAVLSVVSESTAASTAAKSVPTAAGAANRAADGDASLARQALKFVTQHDDGTAWCQLLDQLTQPVPTPALTTAAALPPDVVGPPVSGAAAPGAAGAAAYRARAPPQLA